MVQVKVYNEDKKSLWTVKANSEQEGHEIISDMLQSVNVKFLLTHIILLVDVTTGEVLWEWDI